MSITIAQESRPGTTRGHWNWSVWLDGTREELDRVKSVTYTLHSSFPDPVRTVTNRSSCFRLEESGWGEFQLHAVLQRMDKTTETLTHWVSFGSKQSPGLRMGKKSKPPTVFLSSAVSDVDTAARIREVLEKYGVEVLTSFELAPGDDFEKTLRSRILEADAGVFIVSERPSPWLGYEVNLANSAGLKRSFVTVGRHEFLLDGKEMVPAYQVKSGNANDINYVAREIGDWVHAL